MKSPNVTCQQQAQAHQNQLTKPPGSLGKLEDIAIWLAGCQNTLHPQVQAPWISVFAADHGITEENISAFPSVVTQEMVKNFSAGGAAITVIARQQNAHFEVVDVGVVNDLAPLPHLISDRAGAGTANFAQQPAMTTEQLEHALQAGQRAVERAEQAKADLFIAGEMGIGNTTSATALIAQRTQKTHDLTNLVGAGTGIDETQRQHKTQVIQQALEKHADQMTTPKDALRHIGGFEIAAMAGAYLHCAEIGLPAVVDGVISCAAALIACQMAPEVQPWLLFGHQSVEPAQQAVFETLNVTPLLNLNMRLGEGSGAAATLPMIRLACDLHNQMATFESAQVSTATV